MKDRITLFETSIPCDLFANAYEKAQKVTQWLLDDETLSSAHVWRLRRYAELYRQWIITKNTQYLEYIPLLVYDLKRNWAWKGGELTEARNEARNWVSSLTPEPDVEDMKILKFICEYALLSNRGKANR